MMIVDVLIVAISLALSMPCGGGVVYIMHTKIVIFFYLRKKRVTFAIRKVKCKESENSMRVNPGKILNWMFPNVVWQIDDPEGIYLTFDDGPTPGVTEWILQTLDRYDAKATFFVLGKNVEQYPDLYRMIIERGHKVGNHTYSHQKGLTMSTERYLEDIDLAADMVHSELFRPPYARITRSQVLAVAKRYRIVMWNVLSRDYNRNISPKRCLLGTIRGLKGGDIISLHDSAKSFRNTSYVLPALLRMAREKGLECKILEL